ncbi:cellulose biosynthesis protein BcsD [Sodalis glossinidius]|uniref:cellulose biosynthesis protein BcsD n=1 Tax=Sodalis glossinidius TaxID=63612 RepID=UPI003C715A4F
MDYYRQRQFLNLAGAQQACRFPQPAAATVGDLEDGLNGLWSRFKWAMVRLTPEGHRAKLCGIAPHPREPW